MPTNHSAPVTIQIVMSEFLSNPKKNSSGFPLVRRSIIGIPSNLEILQQRQSWALLWDHYYGISSDSWYCIYVLVVGSKDDHESESEKAYFKMY